MPARAGPLCLALMACAGTTSKPAFPNVVRAACPSECCTLGTWEVSGPVRAFAVPGDTTRAAFTLARGDTIDAGTGEVHVRSPGIVVLTFPLPPEVSPSGASAPGAAAGDTVHVLSYEGEDTWVMWYRGARHSRGRLWVEPGDVPRPEKPGVLVQPLRAEWWVRGRRIGDDAVGWVLAGRVQAGGDWDGMESAATLSGGDACAR